MRRCKSIKQKRKSVRRKSVRRKSLRHKSVRRKSKRIRYNKTDGIPLQRGQQVELNDLEEGQRYYVFSYEDRYIGNGILNHKFIDTESIDNNELYFTDFKMNDFEEPGEYNFNDLFYSFYKYII